MKALSAAVLGLGVMLRVSEAGACSPIDRTVEPLLPLDGAAGVPSNVALISSSQGIGAEYQLRPVSNSAEDPPGDPSDAMGGSSGALTELIPVEVSCRNARSPNDANGALCFAYADLAPNTHYEWSVRVVLDYSEEFPPDFGAWRRFTTGAGPSTTNEPGSVGVEVTRYELYENDPCGERSGATIAFDTRALTEPVVANLVGFTPDYATHAIVLDPAAASVEMRLSNIEGCHEVELFDSSDARTTAGEVCFRDDPTAGAGGSGMPAAGGDGGEPAERAARGGGCSVGRAGAPESRWMLAVTLSVFLGAWGRTRRRLLLSKVHTD